MHLSYSYLRKLTNTVWTIFFLGPDVAHSSAAALQKQEEALRKQGAEQTRKSEERLRLRREQEAAARQKREQEAIQQQQEVAARKAKEEATRKAQEEETARNEAAYQHRLAQEAAKQQEIEKAAQEATNEKENESVAAPPDRIRERLEEQKEESERASLLKRRKELQNRTSARREQKLAETRGMQQSVRPKQFTREEEIQYTEGMAKAQVKFEIGEQANSEASSGAPTDKNGAVVLDDEIDLMAKELEQDLEKDVKEFESLSS